MFKKTLLSLVLGALTLGSPNGRPTSAEAQSQPQEAQPAAATAPPTVSCHSTQEGVLCATETDEQSLCTGNCSFEVEKDDLECRLDTPSVLPRVELASRKLTPAGQEYFIYAADSAHADWKKEQVVSGLITCTDYLLWGKYFPKETQKQIKFRLQEVTPPSPPPPPPPPASCSRVEECTVHFTSKTGAYQASCPTTDKFRLPPKARWVGSPMTVKASGKEVAPVRITFTAPLADGKEEVCTSKPPINVELGKTATYSTCLNCLEQTISPIISVKIPIPPPSKVRSYLIYQESKDLIAFQVRPEFPVRGKETLETKLYGPAQCTAERQARSWDGRSYSQNIRKIPGRRIKGARGAWEFRASVFPFREEFQIADNDGGLFTPYQIKITCADRQKKFVFPSYELGVLVKKATEILPPENRLPLCAVKEGKHEYKEWNDGNSDDGLSLKTLERVNPQNRPPDRFLSESTVIIDEGDSISLKLPQLCSDPDNDPLRYFVRLSSSSPQHLKYSHSTSGQNLILTINPREKHDYTKAAEEPETFKITVQDYQIIENGEVPEERALHAEKPVMSLKIKINPVNDPPEEHDDALFQKRPIFSPTILYPFGYFCREFFDDQDNHDNDDSSNDQLSCQEKIVCAGTELAAEKYQVEVAKNGQRRLTIYAGECEGVVTLDENLNKPSFTPKAILTITASDGHSQTSIKRPFFLYSPLSLHADNFKGNLVIWGDSVAGRANGCQDYLYIKPSASLLQGLSSLFQDGLTTTTYQLEFKTDGNNFTFVKGYNPETIINDILGGLRASVPTGQRVKQYQACLTLVAEKEKK